MNNPRKAADVPQKQTAPAPLINREQETAWIKDALTTSNVAAVTGGARMGKTSLVMQAATAVAASQDGQVIRIDVAKLERIDDLSSAVRPAASTAEAPAAAPETAKRAIKGAVQAASQAAGGEDSAAGQEIGEVVKALLEALKAFSQGNQAANSRTVLVLDGAHALNSLGGAGTLEKVAEALQKQTDVAAILSGNAQINEGGKGVFDGLAGQGIPTLRVQPVEPQALAAGIDLRFAQAGLGAPGVGQRAIELAGNRVGDVMELVTAALQKGLKTGVRGVDAVNQAARELTQAQKPQLDRLWATLTHPEKSVVTALAESPQGQLPVDTPALGKAPAPTVTALQDKGMVERTFDGSVTLNAPGLRGFALEMKLNMKRSESAGQKETRFSFEFGAKRAAAVAAQVKP